MISAYRISDHVYLVSTRDVADPELPRTLPIGSPRLTLEEARRLCDQIIAAVAKPAKAATT